MAWMIATEENMEHFAHYGVPGMEWGVRKYLDETGHLTAAGRERYRSKSTKYTQSEGLQKRKAANEELRSRIKVLSGKENKEARDKTRAILKRNLKTYREDSKAERKAYTEAKKAEREELKREREGLKEVNRYTQYNKGMSKSLDRMNRFTTLLGRYQGKSASEIKSRSDELASKSQAHKDENERIRNQDVREATSADNVARLQAAMKNYKKRRTS